MLNQALQVKGLVSNDTGSGGEIVVLELNYYSGVYAHILKVYCIDNMKPKIETE